MTDLQIRKRGMSQDEVKKSFKQQIVVHVAGCSQEEVDRMDLSNAKDEDV